ncbi:MAG: 50S ribosomal protein L23 [Patescibacteria group bacterium]
MALFGNDKKTEKKKSAPRAAKKTNVTSGGEKVSGMYAMMLTRPRITEKAAQKTAENVYTFEVSPRATKAGVASAIKDAYHVTPVKVNMVNVPAKRVSLRTRRGYGTKRAFKKAYVFLKEGDRIEFSS